MAKVAEARKIVVQYEDFCVNPQGTFEELTEKIGIVDSQCAGPGYFEATRWEDNDKRAAIEKAVLHFSSNVCRVVEQEL